ncbi:HAMP domain-containing sensor histidine kinase [Wukongibacter baidiensis]|uniref:HAMP domain-containing sensor histidine kinase n=1 Tax=Wukongibacter baidiensis TaxID=1723361 RepID=UPI003D7FC409
MANSFGIFYMDASDILENIDTYGLQRAYETSNLPEGSYIEVLDQDQKVIDQYKSIHDVGYKYSDEEFDKLTINSYQHLIVGMNEENDNMLLVYNPKYPENEEKAEALARRILIQTIILFIVSIFTVLLIYAKFTSKTIVRPIKEILEGVKTISLGDYSKRINYKSKSELGYLIEAINQMSEKIEKEIGLREKSEDNRKRLILDISHDIKTPLTNILGYAETLRLSDDISKESRDNYVDIIISNGKKANNLIQDLFELSHIESSNNSIAMESCDLSEFIRKILLDYIPELEDNDMSFEFDIPDQRIMIKMNAQKLDRAISNIINNSIKYSGKGTTLRLELKDLDNRAVLIIEDSGIGIPMDLAKDIFEPFVRADVSRNSKTGGTGLGLGITKAIIEMHGGTIHLDTSYLDGCRFVISIPKAMNNLS